MISHLISLVPCPRMRTSKPNTAQIGQSSESPRASLRSWAASKASSCASNAASSCFTVSSATASASGSSSRTSEGAEGELSDLGVSRAERVLKRDIVVLQLASGAASLSSEVMEVLRQRRRLRA